MDIILLLGLVSAFGFCGRHVVHVRVHAGIHVCLRNDDRAADDVVETHGVRYV